MQRFVTSRRLALLGVVLASQVLTACCLPPIWHGPRGGGRYADGPGGHAQPAPPPPPREPRRPY